MRKIIPKINIAVIGAGVVGLSTAVNLQNRLGNECHVTVIADKFFEEKSYGAAGIFKPTMVKIPGVSEDGQVNVLSGTVCSERKQW